MQSLADDRLEVAFQASHGLDMIQTLHIIQPNNDLIESNPLLQGASREQVVGYFVLTGMIHNVITEALPPKPRKIWQWMTLTTSLSYVGNNIRIGVRF